MRVLAWGKHPRSQSVKGDFIRESDVVSCFLKQFLNLFEGETWSDRTSYPGIVDVVGNGRWIEQLFSRNYVNSQSTSSWPGPILNMFTSRSIYYQPPQIRAYLLLGPKDPSSSMNPAFLTEAEHRIRNNQARHTVDGRNPAPPGMYETCK